MNIALISDVHANLEALSAVLADIYSKGITSIYSLGDIVGYGPNPNECIQLVKNHCKGAILGNHDAAVFAPHMAIDFNSNAKTAIEWTGRVLTKSSMEYLNTLPMSIDLEHVKLVHSTPYEPHQWFYISSAEDAIFNFSFFNQKICCMGHTHIPGIIELNRGEHDISIINPRSYNLEQSENFRYMINVGSVGQPRDKNNKATYTIINTDDLSVSFNRIPYDISSYQEKMKKINMPDFLIKRVQEGR